MDNIIKIKNLSYRVDDTDILKDINLEIQSGQYVTFVGPSGSGKSTLMRIIALMISATSGEIYFDDKDINSYEPTKYRQRVSYAFQQPTLFGKSVQDNLEFPYLIRNKEFDKKHAIDSLEMVNLDESYLKKGVNDISGGERQRVALLRNLLFRPDVLITDEVTAGLDTENKAIVHQMLNTFNQDDKMTILRVTHDETEIDESNDVVRIRGGQLI